MHPSSLTHIHRALLSAGLLSLAACGGGGSSSSTSTTITGVAATGAAFGGALVTITDANGATTSCGATNTSTGAYSCTLGASATAPFVIQALDSESGIALFSVLAEKKDSTANITPLTHAIAAALSPTGDPSALAGEIKASSATVTNNTIATQVGHLETGLSNVLSAAGVSNFNPIGGSFTAGSSSGMDKVLDAVKVSVAPKSDSGSGTQAGTVTIGLRADPDTAITLTNGTSTAPTPIPSSAVQAVNAALNVNPTSLITQLLTKMTTCYALPVASRVDSTASTATASNVAHSDCKAMFYNGDPATFKSGGNVVGARGAFSGLFKDGATGTTFDKGNLEYVVKNPGAAHDGVWVVSYRSTQTNGSVSFDTFALKLDNGQLRQYGNQYDYNTSVRAFVQDREFVNQADSNYLSTGYTLHIANKVDGNGNSVFEKVVVTSPGNRIFTLKPSAGMSYLGLVNAASTTLGTNFVRIGYAPTRSSAPAWTTSADVSGGEETWLFFAPNKWSDADIAALPHQGTWTFNIYLAGNTSDTADVVQKSRTIARAPTIAELRQMKFAALTTSQRTEVISNTSSTHGYVMDENSIAQITDASGNDAWSVPDGALPPTKAQVFGRAPKVNGVRGNSFNDVTTFLPSTRKTSISCSRQSAADLHCASSVAVNATGNYANGSWISDMQLNASSPLMDISKHFAFYQP